MNNLKITENLKIAEKSKTNSAKLAFYYMLSLVALTFMSLGTGMVIFQIINKYVVDQLAEYQTRFNPDILKYAISMLVVAAPIFYAVTRQIFRSLFTGQLDKESGVRRWLVYFILLVSAVVVLGTLVNILNNFLNGELTLKFILKALTVGNIAAIIFSFYLYDIRRVEVSNKRDNVITIYFYASLAIIIVSFIFSLFIMESPTTTRNRKLDNVIISSFDQIGSVIDSYYSEKGGLPVSLDELRRNYNYLSDDVFADPVTGVKFDYQTKSQDEYELCATFRLTSEIDNQYYSDRTFIQRWPHAAGYQCLSQKAHNISPAKIGL
jgi:hypothetical protein